MAFENVEAKFIDLKIEYIWLRTFASLLACMETHKTQPAPRGGLEANHS